MWAIMSQEESGLHPVFHVPMAPTSQKLEIVNHVLHVLQEAVLHQQEQHHFLDVMVNHCKKTK